MAIGSRSLFKSLAQSSIDTSSLLLAWPPTELLLTGLGAYLGAIRGLGWSPTVEQEAKCAARCIQPGHEFVVIDAGANVGSWSPEFLKCAGSTGRIYAFEPQSVAAAKIRALNLPGCEVLELGLADRSGKTVFYTSGGVDSMASRYDRHDSYVKDRIYQKMEVEIVTLDEFVKTRGIDCIDFMKMDLEGGELDAFKGAAECLRSGMLRALTFEFGISTVNSRFYFRDCFQILVEAQYDLFRVTPAGRLIPIPSYSEDHECFARTTTYLARSRGTRLDGTGLKT